MGHASLQWAFSAAAVLFRREQPAAQKALTRLEKKSGQGTACTLLAQKRAGAVYDILKRPTAGEMPKWLQSEGSGAREPVASLDTHGLTLHRALCTVDLLASLNAAPYIGPTP
jgi:hypothetical protein